MKILKDYRIFDARQELDAVENLLKQNEVKYFIQESNEIVDKKYLLQLKPEDFDRVDRLREGLVEIDFESLPADYYLLEYSDDELLDIIGNRSDWSEFDYVLAKTLLTNRKVEFSEMNDSRREIINSDFSENDTSGLELLGNNLLLSYMFACIVGPYFMIRYFVVITAKERIEDGSMVYKYDKNIRKHALLICIIGFVSTFFWIAVYRYNVFRN
ncbi:hypothetical protein [Chryseobacterium sp.]|uniref:hypothetical protein n=1 Tax=Chryseobacterium sp. TaxID=1871047 RepID=UPI0011CC55BC|nr:hypothetical protein [Chryseobacterium sp.]TXF79600.1 hypothetical protein FUA25_04245 [Chryseobacterium sp.]